MGPYGPLFIHSIFLGIGFDGKSCRVITRYGRTDTSASVVVYYV